MYMGCVLYIAEAALYACRLLQWPSGRVIPRLWGGDFLLKSIAVVGTGPALRIYKCDALFFIVGDGQQTCIDWHLSQDHRQCILPLLLLRRLCFFVVACPRWLRRLCCFFGSSAVCFGLQGVTSRPMLLVPMRKDRRCCRRRRWILWLWCWRPYRMLHLVRHPQGRRRKSGRCFEGTTDEGHYS